MLGIGLFIKVFLHKMFGGMATELLTVVNLRRTSDISGVFTFFSFCVVFKIDFFYLKT